MRVYTVADVMAAEPCRDYTESCVKVLWAGRETLTAREIGDLDIPTDDCLWALIHVCLDDRQRRLLACDVADDALKNITKPDPRNEAAMLVARRYAVGEATVGELKAAKDDVAATRDVAWVARATVCDAAMVTCKVAWIAVCDAADCDDAWGRYLGWAVAYAEGEKP